MPPATPPVLNSPSRNGTVVLVPGEKFFIRRVPLAPEGDAAAQVALALEGLSPFPAAQLYYGFRTDTARSSALVFAAYRKNFTAEETAGWDGATAVLPDFAFWLANGATPAAGLGVREQDGRVAVAAWDGRSELPLVLLARPAGTNGNDAVVAEARALAGLGAGAQVRTFPPAAVETTREKRELVVRLAGTPATARLDEAALGHADIRDKALLIERRRTLRRDALLWRGFVATLVGLAACVVLELGLLGMRAWLDLQRKEVTAQQAAVDQIDRTLTLAQKLEDLSAQRLLPFEMLDIVNNKRPKSVEFSSVTTVGPLQLAIQAQTANADDTVGFESDLRAQAGVQKVEVKQKNKRGAMTTFLLEVTFKPGWTKMGGGA